MVVCCNVCGGLCLAYCNVCGGRCGGLLQPKWLDVWWLSVMCVVGCAGHTVMCVAGCVVAYCNVWWECGAGLL